MVRDGRLGDVVAGGDVTGTDRAGRRKLAKDGQADGVCGRLQQPNLRFRVAPHEANI